MIEIIEMHGRSEGCICEYFAYLSNSGVYLNCSDINELADILALDFRN